MGEKTWEKRPIEGAHSSVVRDGPLEEIVVRAYSPFLREPRNWKVWKEKKGPNNV